MKIYAHRGLSNEYPPNSIEAINSAINKDYIDGVEIDIRMTKDKKFVVFHDKNITCHSNNNGCIYDYTLDELKKMNFRISSSEYYTRIFKTINKKYGKKIRKSIRKIKKKKYKITTLNKVLDIIGNKELLIEIKSNYEYDFDIYEFYNLIKRYTGKKIFIQSFNRKIIDRLKEIDINLNLGLLLTINNLDYNKPYDFYSIEYLTITKNKIDSYFIREKSVNLWTVNYIEQLDKISDNTNGKLSLVNYITDNPSLIYTFLKDALY